MILSMTGFGKAEYTFADHKTIIEIRSLNSKQLDLNLKVSPIFRNKETEIRSILSAPLERGKVDVAIYTQSIDGTNTSNFNPINKEAFVYYYQQLQQISSELHLPQPTDLMSIVMHIPDVCRTPNQDTTLDEKEWSNLKKYMEQAINGFVSFRTQEGAALERMFTEKLDGITQLMNEIEPYEKNRVEKIKQHLLQNLDKLAAETKQAIDQNRLEQEMIYYLEKLDVTEEKVRLANHIKYFRETMQLQGGGVGKKLGFIAQEMGREINTLGSKSNQSEMQIIVVKMKDILEQIKEQVLNVL